MRKVSLFRAPSVAHKKHKTVSPPPPLRFQSSEKRSVRHDLEMYEDHTITMRPSSVREIVSCNTGRRRSVLNSVYIILRHCRLNWQIDGKKCCQEIREGFANFRLTTRYGRKMSFVHWNLRSDVLVQYIFSHVRPIRRRRRRVQDNGVRVWKEVVSGIRACGYSDLTARRRIKGPRRINGGVPMPYATGGEGRTRAKSVESFYIHIYIYIYTYVYVVRTREKIILNKRWLLRG
jgi:hypothetical protein